LDQSGFLLLSQVRITLTLSQIVLRLSRSDTSDPTKRRHFEISIDSPFHILSCRATQANTSLPAYSIPESSDDSQNLYECGCPGAAVRCGSPAAFGSPIGSFHLNRGNASPLRTESPSVSSSAGTGRPIVIDLAPPPAAHFSGEPLHTNSTSLVPRPMHIIRAPSYNPPAFDYEEPPPPLETPPPIYDSIASPTTGLADYFARLSDAYGGEDGDTVVENEGAMRTPTQRRSLAIEPLAEATPTTSAGNWI
jgi:hypothetical protein